MNFDTAIIGGGVSGLSTAYDLMRRGHRVVVLERQVSTGGNAVSERFGGFLMEHGPSSVSAAASEAVGLSGELGLDPARCELGDDVRYRYLAGNGSLNAISTHPLGFLLSNYLSPAARLRLMAEVVVPRLGSSKEETIAEFWSRRFGREFTDKVIDPLVAGLYAGKASSLSMNTVFPSLIEMERQYGSVIRGGLSKRLGRGAMPGRRLFSWRDGIAALPSALAARLGDAVRTGVVVTSIKQATGSFIIATAGSGTVTARSVVIATQPHVSSALLEKLDHTAAEAISEIAAPPIAVAFLGYRREQVSHPLDGLGYLAPATENRPLSGALFCSTMFADRVPEGHVSLSGYVGGARSPEMALMKPEDIAALTREEFRDLLGAKGAPVVSRIRQWPRGLPQLEIGHAVRMSRVLDAERRRPGLFITGNYFSGPAVATCLKQSSETCQRIDGYLRGAARSAVFEPAAMPEAARA